MNIFSTVRTKKHLSNLVFFQQMEVSCYPKKTVEEFEKRISQLRGEYKAFVRKAHELEPDLSATPWSDRPYSRKRRKLNEGEYSFCYCIRGIRKRN